jgi:hypothetical protein
MKEHDWTSVLSRFDIYEGGKLKPVEASALSAFERSNSFLLPTSYRGYCQTFGPGFLTRPCNYCICVPLAKSKRFNIDFLNQMVKSQENNYAADVDQINRSIFFATDIGTSEFFWDPTDITDKKDSEYGVYVLYRDYKVERLSDSFWGFINEICLGTGVPAYDNSTPIDFTFEPGE